MNNLLNNVIKNCYPNIFNLNKNRDITIELSLYILYNLILFYILYFTYIF